MTYIYTQYSYGFSGVSVLHPTSESIQFLEVGGGGSFEFLDVLAWEGFQN